MERLKLKYLDIVGALKTFEEILAEKKTVIIRDASIQRFEYTFEALWKYLKLYLEVNEGIVCNSPKACFKSCFSVAIIDEKDSITCLEMTDMRNDTVHTYKEIVADNIYNRLPQFLEIIQKIVKKTILV